MRRALPIALAICLLSGLILSVGVRTSAAATANAGYVGPEFGAAPGSDPTADKPQSKLWHNDGYWWAVMFHKASATWHIFRLTWPSSWVDTGVVVDPRPTARADALSQGAKLYVASLVRFDTTNQGRLYRFSYDSGAKTYALDSGFPVTIMNGSAETMAFDKDSSGRLWITYTQSKQVFVNHTNTDSDPNTDDDQVWATPSVVSGPQPIGSDDISSLVAYNDKNGPSIGVLWSNHTSTSAAASMNFAYRKDSDPPDLWQPIETIYGGVGTCLADDHINLKSLQADPSGAIFAAIKTSVGDSSSCTGGSDLIRLVVRYPNNTWKTAVFGSTADKHTRPVVLLDTTNRKVYMFATAPTSCGVIYYKVANMDNPSFPSGKGTPFIKNSAHTCINNASTTKQTVNASTGLVELASDEKSLFYLHNAISLGSTPTATATATPLSSTPTATATPVSSTPTATATPVSSTPTATATTTPVSSTPTATPLGSTRLKDITFENGSLTDASTGADAVVGTAALESTSALAGSFAATINTTSGYLREDIAASSELFVSFVLRPNALTGANARIALISNGSTSVGNLYLSSSGALQLRNGSTVIGSSSAPLVAGTLYRVGLHQKQGTGGDALLEAYVAVGDAPFGAPFAFSASQSFTSQATRFSLGATNSNAVNLTVDDIRLDTAAMP
jgi:hypothetical protein